MKAIPLAVQTREPRDLGNLHWQECGGHTASTIAANCNGDFVWLVFHYGFHCISKWMLNFYVSGEEMFISVLHQVF